MKNITKKMPKAQAGKIVKAVKSVKPATNIAKDLPKPTGLGSKKNGGPIKKLKKAELGMATEESCGPGRGKCGRTRRVKGTTMRSKMDSRPGNWMSNYAKGGSVAKKKK